MFECIIFQCTSIVFFDICNKQKLNRLKSIICFGTHIISEEDTRSPDDGVNSLCTFVFRVVFLLRASQSCTALTVSTGTTKPLYLFLSRWWQRGPLNAFLTLLPVSSAQNMPCSHSYRCGQTSLKSSIISECLI